jgi:hypothetical protein
MISARGDLGGNVRVHGFVREHRLADDIADAKMCETLVRICLSTGRSRDR